MIDVITSKDNAKIKEAMKLSKDAGERNKQELFFACTSKVIIDILSDEFTPQGLFFMQHEYDKYEKELSAHKVYIITNEINEKLSQDKTPSGAFGIFKMKKTNMNDVFSAKKLIILEDVQDPGNLGAIMRTALALGYENVVVSAKSADRYSPKVLRSSMTASVKMNVFKVIDIPQLIVDLNEKGFDTVATCLENSQSLVEVATKLPVAIVIGNEGQGITEKTMAACKYKVKIPMSDKIESLNAAASAAIVMWQLRGE